MATIQLRRKTTSGSGPLTGTSGTIKQGEPLIDLNGGNLYIAKANKTGSSSNPLSASDYFEFVNSNNLTSVLNSKINELDLGTASKYDVGNGEGQIPVVDSDGFLSSSIIPRIAITNTFVVSSQNEMLKLSQAETGDICIRNDLSKTFILKGEPYSTLANWQELKSPTDKVTSVNGKTGAVNISLSELGGVSTFQQAHLIHIKAITLILTLFKESNLRTCISLRLSEVEQQFMMKMLLILITTLLIMVFISGRFMMNVIT